MVSFRRTTSLPLGVDLGSDFVSVVAADAADEGFTIRETATLDVPPNERVTVDRSIAETLRRIVDAFATRERRCILAIPSGDVITRAFRVPPGMRRGEAERAAALEADSLVEWSASERLVALDDIPGSDEERLLSVGRRSSVDRLVAIARAAGLRPVAVDITACAWRRAIADAEAALDCTGERATLVIFGRPVGNVHVFPPRLPDDRLASNVRSALVEARRDGFADVQRLAILGTPFRFESIEASLRDDGYAVVPVALGTTRDPSWAFAYGLASWSIAPRGIRAS